MYASDYTTYLTSYSLGEYDPKYKSVADTAPIPTFPENSPSRWSILVDSIIVGEKQIAVKTSVATAPGNKAVALLDSGTSYSLVALLCYKWCPSDFDEQLCSSRSL